MVVFLIIDIWIDFLQFLNFNSRLTVLLSSEKTIIKQKSLTSTYILKRSSSSVITQLSEKSFSFSKIEKSSRSVKQSKSCDVTLINIKDFKQFSDSMNIAMIEAATYRTLIRWSNINIFVIIILKIDQLISTFKNKLKNMNLHEFSHVETLEQVKVKLLFKYHDYLDIFNRVMINQLSSHCFYDHKVELINERTFSWSRLYKMFNYKLQKIKEYLIKHLNKKFIFLSFALYILLILFIEKKDDSLRFCVDYRKLNALIKRDCYSLSLIDEILAHIQESKYLTQLNIIVTFNKLCMHLNSENLTIFIIFFDLYKYHVMLFDLINESAFYQYYMNDMLFEYLHQFCQIYLNNIIIYSKTLKEHKWHVWLILQRLQEIDLQININKCKFHMQEIIFLELLIFIKKLKMNSWKIQMIIEWSILINLTQIQFFINFRNFYRCFIKNFSKIVHFMIQLT